jgi:hypothetical protein
MLPIKLFRVLFCLFWFNRNTETLCFDKKKAKQPKQTFCFGSAKTSFGSSFGCFESKIVSKDTLVALCFLSIREAETHMRGGGAAPRLCVISY